MTGLRFSRNLCVGMVLGSLIAAPIAPDDGVPGALMAAAAIGAILFDAELRAARRAAEEGGRNG